MKKYIDIEAWPRKEQYKLFSKMDYPYFGITANVDITNTYNHIKKNNIPFFKTMVYLTTRTANEIDEFRYRIEEDKVIEYDFVHPSFTILTQPEVFSFCTVNYHKDFSTFLKVVDAKIEELNGKVDLEDEPNRDDLLFISSLPWVSFTSITHPIDMTPTDSIPKIIWGKYFEENGRIKLPLSIQANHGLMDGIHLGKYFSNLQDKLDHPKQYI